MPRSQSFTSKLFISFILLLAIGAFSFAFLNLKTLAWPLTPVSTPADGPSGLEWLTVYFTNPNPPDELGQGIDLNVVPLIDAARVSIAVASFDFNLPSVIEALARASQRGVKVMVVYDGVNGNLELDNALTHYQPVNTLQALKTAGVSMVNGGRSNGLMHDKMIIIDGQTLFTGSWNLSYNDTYRNNNNLLKITSPQVIANYQAKFNQMFVDQKFGSRVGLKAIVPRMMIGDTPVENYFSPSDQVMDRLIEQVHAARKSVHYLIYTFTDEDLVSAMIAQAKTGVDVQGVIEGRCTSPGALASLSTARLPVKIDGNPYTMHHKVIIIDRETVITGSFNFTRSADTINDENILVVHNSSIAAQYEQEYQKINSASTAPTAADLNCAH
jgi:phosphatidylserine/phosphatidylglycerophosphate/cardiolipin synthase-like enzyme